MTDDRKTRVAVAVLEALAGCQDDVLSLTPEEMMDIVGAILNALASGSAAMVAVAPIGARKAIVRANAAASPSFVYAVIRGLDDNYGINLLTP